MEEFGWPPGPEMLLVLRAVPNWFQQLDELIEYRLTKFRNLSVRIESWYTEFRIDRTRYV